MVGYQRFRGPYCFHLHGKALQHTPLKRWCPTTTLHGITTEKTSTWITFKSLQLCCNLKIIQTSQCTTLGEQRITWFTMSTDASILCEKASFKSTLHASSKVPSRTLLRSQQKYQHDTVKNKYDITFRASNEPFIPTFWYFACALGFNTVEDCIQIKSLLHVYLNIPITTWQ
jgi:hypothetical protein